MRFLIDKVYSREKNIFLKTYIYFLDAFESRIFPMDKIEGTSFPDFHYSNLKILTPKQILQRIPKKQIIHLKTSLMKSVFVSSKINSQKSR